MKKAYFVFAALAVILAVIVILAGTTATKGSKDYETNTGLVAVSGYENLYYDSQTKVVYFVFNEACAYQGYGYMSPYYAPNGFPYLYDPVKQELVEISYPQAGQTENLQWNYLQSQSTAS